MPLTFTPQLFAILGGLIEARTGIHYSEADRDVLQIKLSLRAEEAGFGSLLDYYYFLKYDPAGERELSTLIEHLVVRETYLFREVNQLRVLVDRVLLPAVQTGRHPRVWTAACSTGEEPLTLALLLAERGVLDDVPIVAGDISVQALARAREGRFARRSLRAMPDTSRYARWLQPATDGSVTVHRRLVDHVDWRRINLVDPAQIAGQGQFDVILCRNVLIYFSDETTRRVVDGLTGALRPDGLLLVSVTESLLRFGTSLSCDELDGVFMYRKAAT